MHDGWLSQYVVIDCVIRRLIDTFTFTFTVYVHINDIQKVRHLVPASCRKKFPKIEKETDNLKGG